jgi:TRAP-type C4-dicarboxylate transport system permease small subunit
MSFWKQRKRRKTEQGMARVLVWIEMGVRFCAAFFLLVLLIMVLLQVGLRYGGGSVPAYTEEVARYSMLWMALLATTVAVREGSHIRIDIVPDVLRARMPGIARVLKVCLDVLTIALFLVLTWYGIDMVQFAASQTSDGLRVPLSYPYLIVPAAFFLSSVFAITKLLVERGR